MLKMESVDFLCRTHTDLSEQEINKISSLNETLKLTADLNRAHIFIDCFVRDKTHGIVVYEAVPETAIPIYKNSIAGKYVFESFEPAVFQTLHTGKSVFTKRALTHEGSPVEQSVIPIRGENDRVIAALIMEKGITENLDELYQLKALSKTAKSLSDVLLGMIESKPKIPDVIQEALFFVEPNGSLLYFNPPAFNLVSEIRGLKCEQGADITNYLPELNYIFSHSKELFVQEITVGTRVLRAKKIDLSQNGDYGGMFIILSDLTELREKEKQLVMKSVAIREVHHRVKNNLQTVASLLRLQMRRGLPEESKVYFKESLNRILSIASVYEEILSKSGDENVEVFNLSKQIGNMLVYGENLENRRIDIDYKGVPLTIESERAVSIALIINELIQNCIKHAFEDKKTGTIMVTLSEENGMVTVEIKDNGKGINSDIENSLGLDIVKMISENDLSGVFEMKKGPVGTTARVIFPLEREVYSE